MTLETFRNFRGNQRGDTIVEVLIAIAIIGAVLGAAYVATNNNAQINRATQERLYATKIAESQLEYIKTMASIAEKQTELFNASSDFCVTSGLALSNAGNASCRLNSAQNPTTEQPYFDIVVQPGAPIGSPPAYSGEMFTVTVSWDSILNEGKDQVVYQYGVYR